MKKKVAIIGSGPAALMLAAKLDETRYDITLFERNRTLGRKFLVAGDGGFNLTHSESPQQFIARYTPSSFIEKSFYFFNNADLCEWLKNIGIETYTGSSKRVYPVKGIKPIAVLNAILNQLVKKQISIQTDHTWVGWNQQGNLIFIHKGTDSIVQVDITIFALGGKSWSITGSDGMWTTLFEEKGISIVPFQSSNCAYLVEWDKTFLEQYEGMWLKNCSVWCDGTEKKGELVITRAGLEGGAIYALSPEIRKEFRDHQTATIFIDFKPSLSVEGISNRLLNKGNKSITNLLKGSLNLSDVHIALLRALLNKEGFTDPVQLAIAIKKYPVIITGVGPIDEAISTVGGIDLNEVDEFFQLITLPDNYVIGEMLDWDASTGGYLLQACFSMGAYLAACLNSKE